MKLDQLEQLIEINNQKSISKAAQELYVARSALSESLSKLEGELNIKIFERSATGVIPTTEGSKIIQMAKQVTDIIEQMKHLGKQDEELYGTVTVIIGQAHSFLCKDILYRFHKKHPKAKLHLQICSPDQLLEKLMQERYPLALALFLDGTQEINQLKQNGWKAESFGESNIYIYVGRDHPMASVSYVTKEQMQQMSFVMSSSKQWEMTSQLFDLDCDAIFLTDKDALNQILSKGDLATVLPDFFSRNNLYFETGLIRSIPIAAEYAYKAAHSMLFSLDEKNLTMLEKSTLQILRELATEI